MNDDNLNHSIKIAHLTMIQGVITRMGANSFTLKTLSISLAAAFVAVITAAKKPSYYYIMGAVIPIVMFWLMDAGYLRLERMYRRMYDAVRTDAEIEAYSMDATIFSEEIAKAWKLAFTWSLAWFYLAVLIGLIIISSLIINGGNLG